MVAPGSSLVTDSKINAQDTGRLVSGTDGSGNAIPPDTFVGAVSDTGPYTLLGNASASGASNNFAKPWIGTFQLLERQRAAGDVAERVQRERHPER